MLQKRVCCKFQSISSAQNDKNLAAKKHQIQLKNLSIVRESKSFFNAVKNADMLSLSIKLFKKYYPSLFGFLSLCLSLSFPSFFLSFSLSVYPSSCHYVSGRNLNGDAVMEFLCSVMNLKTLPVLSHCISITLHSL